MEQEKEQPGLTLRDQLAKDRTTLANERTLLAYVRTSFGFAAGGATLLKLFPAEPSSRILGVALILAGLVIVASGVLRFYRTNLRLNQLAERHEG